MVNDFQQIHQDHVNIDKVLTVLLNVGGDLPDTRSEDALSVLNDCLYYIEVFPEQYHHPKEEKVLFPLVRKKRPDLVPVLEELEDQHEKGSAAIGELADLLGKLRSDWSANRSAFEAAVRSYVESQRHHMNVEEQEILKPLKASLESADILSLNSAFGGTVDPLFGANLATGFDALLRRITR